MPFKPMLLKGQLYYKPDVAEETSTSHFDL